MGTQSKYAQTKSSRVSSRKRTVSVHGSGDDDGKWFRCWYCGFINNIDRNDVGPGEGLSYSIAIYDNTLTGMDASVAVGYGDSWGDDYGGSGTGAGETEGTYGYVGFSGKSVLMTNGPFSERHNVVPDVVSGCSFCGCRNYR